jgi:hypothetical protein
MLRVSKVEYLSEYKLKIAFSNGGVKVVDFEDWIFQDNFYLMPLREVAYFKKVHLDDCNYSICWPNGADFSPDVLYEVGKDLPRKRAICKPRNTLTSKRKPKSRINRLKK